MGWNVSYPYAGRQPPTARSMVRKTGMANVGSNRNGFERGTPQRTSGIGYLREEGSVDGNDFLVHFGIPGMKWGQRRYQNEDGSLTEEGKKRYAKDSEPESKKWKKSDAERLSDDELNRRTNRLQREQNYKNLTTTQSERDRQQLKNEIKKDFLKKALILPIAGVLAYAGTKAIKNNGTKMVDMLEKYGKKAVTKIKTNNLLKQAATRGREKYQRAFSEGQREYFPRKPFGYGERTYGYVQRKPPLWNKAARNWPSL